MIKSFFTLAIRTLLKRKLYSFINITGLAVGVAVCLVILKYVDFEMSYDSFHKNAESIYRVTTKYWQNEESREEYVVSGYALGPALQADFPEVKNYIRTHPMYGGAVITYKPDDGDAVVFSEEEIQFVDSTFFDVFTYESTAGNLATVLDDPNAIVLTRKMAEKYFGKEDPIGKILKISGGWSDQTYAVSAIVKDVPANSHLTFDFIIPIHNLLQSPQYRNEESGWGWNNFITYVQLHDNVNMTSLNEKVPAFIEKHQGEELAEGGYKALLNFQPLRSIHLLPGLSLDPSPTASKGMIYFFILISVFILAIAWINYINLATARATERAREVGIKKAIGAVKTQLMWQFIFESILVNLIAVVAAVLLAVALLPVLGQIVGKELVFDFSDVRFWSVLFILFVFGSAVSGAYPAFVLSSFNTIEVIKGKVANISGGFSLRKALVVFQFASSLLLIAGTFAIYRQVSFMRNQDKGLTMDQMLVVSGPRVVDWKDRKQALMRFTSFKDQLGNMSGVESVATSGAIPGGGYNWGTTLRKDGAAREEDKRGCVVWVDPDFVSTYGIEVIAGRSFNPAIRSDMESVLVNEASLKAFNLGTPEQALNERLVLGEDTVQVLGVLKNYHWNSLKIDHTPWLFKADSISSRCFSVHLQGSNFNKTIAEIESLFKEMFPGNPFNYYFLDEFFNNQYQDEKQFAEIFGLFAVLAIIIACLGLWGLAAFTTSLRLKEIGIRKVLGASTPSVMRLLSWQFLQLVLIACVIALPLAWYAIDQWLSSFAFRIGMEPDLFIVPVLVLMVISLATVSLQILRGANANPARTLRAE